MPKKGKGTGSITQKADDQQIRISQVSNVNKAVSNMGRKTTMEMQETKRRVAAGSDMKEISGSMTGVLESLKATVDSLQRGVEAATLGTAKATQEAIKQYGQAISEDFKVNRQNLVASAMSSSTPIFGYFASKFLETDIFKKTKERLSESLSGVFSRKSKGGAFPDEFGGGGGNGFKESAKEAKKEAENRKKEIKDMAKEKYQEYEAPFEEKLLTSLSAIQSVLQAQPTRFEQWYTKFLLTHPYYRMTMRAFKGISASFKLGWRSVYFFFKPRGGYKSYLSKAKTPLESINQNIAMSFLQTMPRLDAIMIYTKATAIAIRDLASHTTGKKYEPMDPSRLGASWSIAGSTMKGLRAIGSGLYKAGKWATGKIGKKYPMLGAALSIPLELAKMEAIMTDMLLTGPGRMKSWYEGRKKSSKEYDRMFGGLAGTGPKKKEKSTWFGLREPAENFADALTKLGIGPEGQFGRKKPKKTKWGTAWYAGLGQMGGQEERKKSKKFRIPKFFKGMGRRVTPDVYTQNVYDEYRMKEQKAKEKQSKKMLGLTVNLAKGMQEHNKREKRKSVWSFLGGILTGAKNLIGGGLSWILKLFTGGLNLGGLLKNAIMMIFGKGGPLLSILGSPWFWGPIGAGLVGYGIGTVINKYFTGPLIQGWVDKEMEKSRQRGKHAEITGAELGGLQKGEYKGLEASLRKGNIESAQKIDEMPTMMQNFHRSFIAGRFDYMGEHIGEYGEWTAEEIKIYRREHFEKFGKNMVTSAGKGWKDVLLGAMPGAGLITDQIWSEERAYKAGQDIEESFLDWLNGPKKKEVMGDTKKRAEYADRRKRMDELKKKYGEDKSTRELDLMEKAGKKAEIMAKKAANAETNKQGGLTMAGARKWAEEHGGEYWEYLGVKKDQAIEIAKKYGTMAKEKASVYATITAEKAEELAKKYKLDPKRAKEFLGKTVDQAESMAKTLAEKAKKELEEYKKKHGGEFGGGGAQGSWTETATTAAGAAGAAAAGATSWFGQQWGKLKNWFATEKPAEKIISSGSMYTDLLLTKAGLVDDKGTVLQGEDLQKAISTMSASGLQYMKEIGAGKHLEGAKGTVTELTGQVITPERKEWLRRNASELIASGQMTVEQLKKLGIQVTDKMLETSKKAVNATQQAAVYTTQNISNSISSQSNGGGGGGGMGQLFFSDASITRIFEGSFDN
jgi:hypothetical protein